MKFIIFCYKYGFRIILLFYKFHAFIKTKNETCGAIRISILRIF